MNNFDAELILTQLFARIRKCGFRPGVGKYLAAISALEKGYCNSSEDLKLTLRLLWCQSRDELALFEPLWDEVWEEHESLFKQQQQRKRESTHTIFASLFVFLLRVSY